MILLVDQQSHLRIADVAQLEDSRIARPGLAIKQVGFIGGGPKQPHPSAQEAMTRKVTKGYT